MKLGSNFRLKISSFSFNRTSIKMVHIFLLNKINYQAAIAVQSLYSKEN
jgi:hypothetical protein